MLLLITGCVVLAIVNPSRLVTAVFTVTETSTTELNTTVQVRVTPDPKGGIGLSVLLDSITELGFGTAENYDRNGQH